MIARFQFALITVLSGLILAAVGPQVCLAEDVPFPARMIEVERRTTFAVTKYLIVTVEDGVVTGITNRLTGEKYLVNDLPAGNYLKHMPAGLGTQAGDDSYKASETLYRWAWYEHKPNRDWPNYRYPDSDSKFTHAKGEDASSITLTWTDLTDGAKRYPDESYALTIELEDETGDILITPSALSPRGGVYAANLTFATLANAITIEAPVFDGVRFTRDMEPALWLSEWAGYWDYGLIALNGSREGAVGIWAQDEKLRYHKHLFVRIDDDKNMNVTMSMMNTPPFDKLTESKVLPWRISAFAKGWPELAARYRAWRDEHIKIAKRPEWTKHISFVNSGVNAGKMWVDIMAAYLGEENLSKTLTFAATIRAQGFDKNHWDNTIYDGFPEQIKEWDARGPKLMAYLQPMIMWGGNAAQTPEDKKTVALADAARTHHVFQQKDGWRPYADQHHLGHADWQRWFLDWVHTYCEAGAHGVYHDQSYHCPIDSRGPINGMTSPQGMADYFYKAQAENPNTIHGTEHLTEVNIAGASIGIGSGVLWGEAPSMRKQRINNASPISNALHYPHGTIWAFPHYSDFASRGDTVTYHWGIDLMVRRGDLPGQHLQNQFYKGGVIPFEDFRSELWYDRTRALTFLEHGLRPTYPGDWPTHALTCYTGDHGEDFRYERTPWGTRLVEVATDGSKTTHTARAFGWTHADTQGAIAGWPFYNDQGPSGLHPDRYYVIDPSAKRPDVYFSPAMTMVPFVPTEPTFFESFLDDGFVSDAVAMLHIKPLPSVGNIISYDKIKLHAPVEPTAVYVNGKLTKPQPQDDGTYLINFQTPADICVVLKEPEPGISEPHKHAVQRVTNNLNVNVFDQASMTAKLRAWMPKESSNIRLGHGLPAINYRGVQGYQLHLPIKAPANGTLTVAAIGDKRNKPIVERFAINGVAQDVVKDRGKAGPYEVPLKAGQTMVLSYSSEAPIDFEFQWNEADSADKQP